MDDPWREYFQALGFEYTYEAEKDFSFLEELEKEVARCQKCRLHRHRTQTVFGVGNPQARILFIGEGPGEEEDKQGIPFVGRAGQLLTKMIEAMGLKREEVYIANVIKCRPPNNRDPEPDEIEACMPYLKAQISFIQPEVIIALGKFASQALTGSPTPITKMRGHWYSFEDIPLMPTYHPSYLLRQQGQKKYAWEDLKKVMKRLGMPIPDASR